MLGTSRQTSPFRSALQRSFQSLGRSRVRQPARGLSSFTCTTSSNTSSKSTFVAGRAALRNLPRERCRLRAPQVKTASRASTTTDANRRRRADSSRPARRGVLFEDPRPAARGGIAAPRRRRGAPAADSVAHRLISTTPSTRTTTAACWLFRGCSTPCDRRRHRRSSQAALGRATLDPLPTPDHTAAREIDEPPGRERLAARRDHRVYKASGSA